MPKRSRISTSNSAAAMNAAYDATRITWWRTLRGGFGHWLQSWPLPNVNPDIISIIGLFLGFLFVSSFAQGYIAIAWLYLALHLLFDGLDGAIAKKFHIRKTKKDAKHGQMVDVVVDRVSEGIIFVWPAFFLPWFPLFLLNIVLTIFAMKHQHALILPLRQIFFIVFTVSLLF